MLVGGSGPGREFEGHKYLAGRLANYEFFNPTISNTNGDGPAMEGDPFISLPEASDPVPVVWSSTASADGFNDFFAVDVVQYEINRAGPDSQSGSQHRVWPVRGGSVPLN